MKKEILFKGKRVDNGEWVYGDLLTKDPHHRYAIVTDGCVISKVVPETVAQFTGLIYENGDRIFEEIGLSY